MAITDDLCRSWLDLLWHFDPAAGSLAGAPGADVRLGRFDPGTVREHLAAARAIAIALEDLALDDVADEIDRTALLADLRQRIARFELDQPHVRNPGFWLDHLGRALLALREPGPDPEGRSEALLARLHDVPDFLTTARATLRRPPVVLADAAVAMVPALVEFIHDLAASYDDLLSDRPGELAGAATEAEAALTRLRLALINELGPDEDPHGASLGEERYGWILHHAFMLRASAGEAWRWGNTVAEQVEAEVATLARQINPDQPWQETFEALREESLITGDLLEAGALALAGMRQATGSLDLAGLSAGEISVREAPTWVATLAPFTFYEPPSPRGAESTGTLYLVAPSGPLDPESAAWRRGELDAHRLAVLAAHDGWPGRHAQALAAAGARSEVRRWVTSPIAVAGWGCYAEELMVESGPLAGPAERLSQRVLLLVRALRVVIDAGIHTSQLTPGAAMELLMTRVPMDRHAALAEVRRVCSDPGAAAAFALGRRELLDLRSSWRRQAGAAVPLRQFHEEVLSFGRLPVTLIRWGMGVE
jgi:uncharacterized protein (DUF885 family)